MPNLPTVAPFKIYFPDAGGGPNVGPSDAGAEHFAGNLMAHLARECAQNAIDARKGNQPITLKFKLEQIKANDIPEFTGGLSQAWDASAAWWGENGNAYPNVFSPAKAMKSAPVVPVLVISDSNTKGLEGINIHNDEAGKSWTNLVKSTGVANSNKGAGGAFGIGKMAPFACSALRTVFYQTCSQDGWGFQGVVRLMTHRNPVTNHKLQPFGMIGLKGTDPSENCEISLPVTSRNQVPKEFSKYRNENEFGTDIFVVGFIGDDEWKLQVKAALITNFFPAIIDGYAKFEVDGEKIDQNNIQQQLISLKNEAIQAELEELTRDLEHSHWYIEASKASRGDTNSQRFAFEKDFKFFGKVRIGIVQGTKDDIKIYGQLPARCFMCRKNRMKIFSKSYQLPFPFAAFMICDDERGNELLRRLEPPTHTAWEKDRDKSPKHEVYNELNKIYNWIRDEVAKLAPPISDESLMLDSVAKAIKGLDLQQDNGGEVNGNDAESLIKKGLKRSPFTRATYGTNSIKLPTKEPSGPTPRIEKKYKVVEAKSSFSYRGNSRYIIKITPKTSESFKGNEIVNILAVNFNGSFDQIAFDISLREADDQINMAKVTRSSEDKFAPVDIPQGHQGEIVFAIKTEIELLSLDAQILEPILDSEEAH